MQGVLLWHRRTQICDLKFEISNLPLGRSAIALGEHSPALGVGFPTPPLRWTEGLPLERWLRTKPLDTYGRLKRRGQEARAERVNHCRTEPLARCGFLPILGDVVTNDSVLYPPTRIAPHAESR